MFRDYWNYLKGEVEELSALQAKSLVNQAWADIRQAKQNWSFLADTTVITVPDAITAGTVTVTQDSPTVLADAAAKTPLDAAGATALKKYIFRSGINGPIYNISDYDNGAGNITLDRNYYEATTVGAAYKIYQAYVVAPSSDFEVWLAVKDPINSYPLKLHYTREELNRRDPYRGATGLPIWLVSYAYNADGLPRYEMWPHPVNRRAYPALFRKRGSDLSDTVDLPFVVPKEVLLERGLLRVYQWAEANKGRFESLNHDTDWRFLMDRANKRYEEALQKVKIHDENIYLDAYGASYLTNTFQNAGIIDGAYWQEHAPWSPM